MRRILYVVLCLILLAVAFSIPSYCNESNSSIRESVKYRIQFSEGISFDSQCMKSNLMTLENNIDQVLFTVDAGEDVFTIGYHVGERGFDYATMYDDIENAVKELNNDILHDERLKSNRAVSVNDLNMSYAETTGLDSHAIFNNGVDNIPALSCVDKVTEINRDVLDVSIQRSTAEAFPIDGSYHFQELRDDEPVTLWHNQVNNTDSVCDVSLLAPHMGDADNRYESGYQWFPDKVEVELTTDFAHYLNYTKLWYTYKTSHLENLVIDDNEALEMEVVFYNYHGIGTKYKDKGLTFQKIIDDYSFITNQPSEAIYLDTHLCDGDGEVSFCVGVDNASLLKANKWYYWRIPGDIGTRANNFPNDGRFKVVAQRSYRYLIDGAYGVFAEEHEPILKLGIDPKKEDRWLPKDHNAWYYADTGGKWTFNSMSDPVK